MKIAAWVIAGCLAWLAVSILAVFVWRAWFTRYQRRANRNVTKRRNR